MTAATATAPSPGPRAAEEAHIDSKPSNPALRLSARELQIVRLVANGWPNKAIAAELALSPLTVKNHLARIGRKFGACNRAHIVAIACRGGVIPGVAASPTFIDQTAI